ncbi:hypothetical protein BC828DRAFT_71459 [Blastocladiella britannica]|nr:hypothetical protein BC828DRAFT_71459 [Blastocladiella britannica]
MYPELAVATESWPLLQMAAKLGNVHFLNKYFDPWVGKEQRDEKDKEIFVLAYNSGRTAVLNWFASRNRALGRIGHRELEACVNAPVAELNRLKAHGYLVVSRRYADICTCHQPDVLGWMTADKTSNDLAAILSSKDFIRCLGKLGCEKLDWWWARSPSLPSPDVLGLLLIMSFTTRRAMRSSGGFKRLWTTALPTTLLARPRWAMLHSWGSHWRS